MPKNKLRTIHSKIDFRVNLFVYYKNANGDIFSSDQFAPGALKNEGELKKFARKKFRHGFLALLVFYLPITEAEKPVKNIIL